MTGPNPGHFKPGQTANPARRPKGSRNKLGEEFLADLQEHWHEHGKEAIKAVYEQRPHLYLKVVASLMPKQLETFDDKRCASDWSDAELKAFLNEKRANASGNGQSTAADKDGEIDGLDEELAPDGLVH